MHQHLYIKWSESNDTGIAIIDEQHKGIVSAVNSLHYCISSGYGEEMIKPVMSIIKQYTVLHFGTEEKLLRRFNYPAIEQHLSLHRQLQAETAQKRLEAIDRGDAHIALAFLKEWWLTHINQEDTKYVSYITSQNAVTT
ncbi:MAG: bacteriohemerythrin [Chitinivibrionales bacterium]|nr:bacteriohemerythrin [Chitinivibrionales bacterium]